MWKDLKAALGKRGHFVRHEDLLNMGIPDVSFGVNGVQGWIELKAIEKWPKYPRTIVSIDHYTSNQRLWLFMRGRAGDHVWLLLRVVETNEWLLFDYMHAQRVGKIPMEDLIGTADKTWFNQNPDPKEFIQAITVTK